MVDTMYLIVLPVVVMLIALYTAWTGFNVYDSDRPRGFIWGFLAVISWGVVCMTGWMTITCATSVLDTVYPERVRARIETLQNQYDTIIKFRHEHE